MGVYIKGMEMPKEDEEIIIRIDSNGTVMTEYALPIYGTKAISVSPHGRLIDADALCASHKEVCSRSMKFNLDLAPTVIPASEEEET